VLVFHYTIATVYEFSTRIMNDFDLAGLLVYVRLDDYMLIYMQSRRGENFLSLSKEATQIGYHSRSTKRSENDNPC
jgi:hypothetical protein